MHRYFIKLAFNGTRYHGWQIQDNANTVQLELNEAISKLLGYQIETMGCGRTDTGVHAKIFFAHFDTIQPILEFQAFVFKLNKILFSDIAVFGLFEVNEKSHVRFDALSRTYEYQISRSKDPFSNETSYYLFGPLNIEVMNQACEILMQFEDFSSFSKSKTQVLTNKCRITEAYWEEKGDKLIFKITADRFLRNMVRAIVGTMLDVGRQKLSLTDFESVIKSKRRSNSGYSVPACGLALVNITYPKDIFHE